MSEAMKKEVCTPKTREEQLAMHPLVAVNRMPADQVERLCAPQRRPHFTGVTRSKAVAVKGTLDWRQLPDRVMVDEVEDPAEADRFVVACSWIAIALTGVLLFGVGLWIGHAL
jgi:hypothetical protein